MTRAFIVHMDVPSIDSTSLIAEAEDIHDVLEAKGYEVISVAPWQGQATTALTSPSPLLTPSIQPPSTPPSLF